MQKRTGDRRSFRRLDVIGELGVALTLSEEAILRNVGPNGALIETTIKSLQVSHEVRVHLAPSMPVLRAVVRHVSPLDGPAAPREKWRRVGLEFLALSWSDAGYLHRFIDRFHQPRAAFEL
jgi:hypothetical protein